MKVVIYVEGGVVQEVFSDDPDVRIELVDEDNLKADGFSRDERGRIFDKKMKGLGGVDIVEEDYPPPADD